MPVDLLYRDSQMYDDMYKNIMDVYCGDTETIL